MRKYLSFFCVSIFILYTSIQGQIIADHSIVDRYDDIPQEYIDSVKKMWLVVAGESHSAGYRTGLNNLETLNSTYAVSVTEYGTPEAYTTSNLRVSRGTWGDVNNTTGWRYGYGEEDWFTSSTAINRTKDGISYCKRNDLTIGAMGFGWCWDPGVNFTDYINATRSYIEYCADSINTQVFFTTGTVDGYTGESGYIKHLGYEEIRDSVKAHSDWVLFDYADILCYDDDGTLTTISWNGNTYPHITSTNLGSGNIGHIGEAGVLRLAKAMWWMLARIAGWNGELPVELTSFSAAVSGDNVILNWQTATEVNNYGFEIERKSFDADASSLGHLLSEGWEKVGFVKGNGNSNVSKSYSFIDNNLTSCSYSLQYRLKQIDIDGKFEYSKEIEVNINNIPSEYALEQNYPNPFNPTTMINYQLPMNSDVNLTIYNLLGQEVAALVNERQEAGSYKVKFDGSQLTSGVYLYKLQAGEFISIRKLMLLK